MTPAEKMCAVAAVVLGIVVLFLYLPGDEKKRYLAALGDPAARGDAVIGLYVLKEDVVPFLAGELKGGKRDPETEAGIVMVLARKYLSHPDPRVEEVLKEVLPAKAEPVRREIYRLAVEARNPAWTRTVVRGLFENTPDIQESVLKGLSFYYAEVEKDVSLKERMISRLLLLRKASSPRVAELAGSFVGREIRRRVEDARRAARNFDFVHAGEILEKARRLDPESPLANYALGKFYLATGTDRRKGTEILSRTGFLYRVTRTAVPPRVDGSLDDEAWKGVSSLSKFYQSISGNYIYRTATIDVKAYLRYDDENLYVGAAARGPYRAFV